MRDPLRPKAFNSHLLQGQSYPLLESPEIAGGGMTIFGFTATGCDGLGWLCAATGTGAGAGSWARVGLPAEGQSMRMF